jgi:hypothetical protein
VTITVTWLDGTEHVYRDYNWDVHEGLLALNDVDAHRESQLIPLVNVRVVVIGK